MFTSFLDSVGTDQTFAIPVHYSRTYQANWELLTSLTFWVRNIPFTSYVMFTTSLLTKTSWMNVTSRTSHTVPVVVPNLPYYILCTVACCILNFQVSIVLKQEMKMCIENGWCMRLGALMIFTQEVNSISPMVLREEFVTRSRWCLPGFQNGGVDKPITWYR